MAENRPAKTRYPYIPLEVTNVQPRRRPEPVTYTPYEIVEPVRHEISAAVLTVGYMVGRGALKFTAAALKFILLAVYWLYVSLFTALWNAATKKGSTPSRSYRNDQSKPTARTGGNTIIINGPVHIDNMTIHQ